MTTSAVGPAPAAEPRWRRAILGGGLIWFCSRALVTAVAALSQLAAGTPELGGPDGFLRLLAHWDSAYFLGIARDGYFGAGSLPSWPAFFPGYPLAARGVGLLLDPSGPDDTALLAGLLLVAALGGLVAAILLWRLAEESAGPRAALLATALVFAGPYSLFLAASYSESLFLAFAVLAWWFGRHRLWWAAGAAAALASSVRATGVFLVVALVVMYLGERHRRGMRLVGVDVVGPLLGLAGVGAYFAYLFANTGSLTVWVHAQSLGWNRVIQWPWLTFYQTAGRVLFASTWDRRVQYGLDILFAALIIVAIVWLARRRDWPAVALVGLTALSLMTSFSYLSLARNSATLFPIALALVTLRGPARGNRLLGVIFIAGLVLLIFNTHQFALGLWAD